MDEGREEPKPSQSFTTEIPLGNEGRRFFFGGEESFESLRACVSLRPGGNTERFREWFRLGISLV